MALTNFTLRTLAAGLAVGYCHVGLEGASPGKAFIAVETNERLLARVQNIMFLQVGPLLKGPATRTASKGAGAARVGQADCQLHRIRPSAG